MLGLPIHTDRYLTRISDRKTNKDIFLDNFREKPEKEDAATTDSLQGMDSAPVGTSFPPPSSGMRSERGATSSPAKPARPSHASVYHKKDIPSLTNLTKLGKDLRRHLGGPSDRGHRDVWGRQMGKTNG